MYLGEIVELNDSARLFADPAHPYTRALIAAVPDLRAPAAGGAPIRGEVPDPFAVIPGCRFAPRCPLADTACAAVQALHPVLPAGLVRCCKA